MSAIRHARPSDAHWLVQMTSRFAAETGEMRLLPDDPEVAGALWLNAISDHLVLIVEEDGPRGFMLGWKGYHPFNPALRTLSEALFYVQPSPAQARLGLALLKAFTEYGDKNAAFTTVTLLDAGERTLKGMGYTGPERTYSRWSAK